MKKLLLLVTLASSFSFTERAEAAHCSHNQIYRVSMRTCVSIHSALARGYVHASTPIRRSIRHMARRCDPRRMCGDPIEDRVEDEQTATPPATSDPTPRGSDWLPDAFTKSQLGGVHIDWRL